MIRYNLLLTKKWSKTKNIVSSIDLPLSGDVFIEYNDNISKDTINFVKKNTNLNDDISNTEKILTELNLDN